MTLLKSALLAAFMLAATYSSSYAQSYIFAVPGATVMDKGTRYFEGDALPAPAGGFTLGARGLYGLADNLEVGLTSFTTFSGGLTSSELQPNLKYRWYNNNDLGLQISTGVVGYFPLANIDEHPFGMLYTVGRYQTKIAGNYSPAISAGGWGLINNNTPGSKAGVILGIEQPLILDGDGKPKVSLVADWMSGNQSHAGFSSLNIGPVFQLTPSLSLGAGYMLSNVSRRNDSVLVWLGLTF